MALVIVVVVVPGPVVGAVVALGVAIKHVRVT